MQYENGHIYIIRDESGEQLAQYRSAVPPPLKGETIVLKGIADYEHAEVLSVIWLGGKEFNTITVKVRSVKRDTQ